MLKTKVICGTPPHHREERKEEPLHQDGRGVGGQRVRESGTGREQLMTPDDPLPDSRRLGGGFVKKLRGL